MIDGPGDIRPEWLAGAERIGLTAGASAPEVLVLQVIARLREMGAEKGWRSPSAEPEGVYFPFAEIPATGHYAVGSLTPPLFVGPPRLLGPLFALSQVFTPVDVILKFPSLP